MDLEIKKGDNKFYIGENEINRIAEITYYIDNEGNIIANHTFVSPAFRGQGIARRLVDQLVLFAREENRKIIPLCSYVAKVFDEDESFVDVMVKK